MLVGIVRAAGVIGGLIGLGVLGAGAAAAQPSDPVRAMVECKRETDPTKRLACLDAAAAELERRTQAGEVSVRNRRDEERRLQREFGQAERARRKAEEELARSEPERPAAPPPLDVEKLESTVASANFRRDLQLWTVKLADGAMWRQIDGGRSTDIIRAGRKVVIKKGVLGSFHMTVEGNRAAMRVRRLN